VRAALSLTRLVHAYPARTVPTVISHLSVGEHAMDEEGFQRTMRYIFTFIEKVRCASLLTHPLTNTLLGKTSRKHRREAMPAFPAQRRHTPMARHRVLSLVTPIQIRALREEARRGSAILPRQTTRRRGICAFPRDPRQGTLPPTHTRFTVKLMKLFLKARSNKAANKSDSELNEFESVRATSDSAVSWLD
jgi:condensin complex subunit 1